ncbi:hypothetical protein NDA11_006908 [Ustilago hordei]|uniref:Related to Mig1 protein n=1 Tax=Ustilago hordei TaxID=120017 RepID=I2FY59_USTHO|nr:hypothetical protein NDA11_006908 [Ustilago hordei]KAJ1600400.1 hypothetical protein NDA14_007833 [Ustilago hordei]CCF51852.1 related to Mig1 protein [Ustilago hordei]
MTRPLQCLISLVVLALVLCQSGHYAVAEQSSAPGSKTPLYDEKEISFGHLCNVTPLFVNRAEYDIRCGTDSHSKGPCFKTLEGASLQYNTIEPWLEPLDMSKEIILKDNTATAFTLRDPWAAFVIKFTDANVSLRYYDYDVKTGCYKIHLQGAENFRIYVTDGLATEFHIDTLHYQHTGKQLCSKWISIGIRHRDGDFFWHDSDYRGI